MNYFRYQERSAVPEKLKKVAKPLMGQKIKLSPFTVVKDYYALRELDEKKKVAEDGRTIGVMDSEGKIYKIGNIVEIRADSDGYICPSIIEEGLGKIVRILINGDVHLGVQMQNGEYGQVSLERVWRVVPEPESSE